MFNFLQLVRSATPRWISPEPSSGQVQPRADSRKKELRVILRESREKLKQEAQTAGRPWGAEHLNQLIRFIQTHRFISSSELNTQRLTIASYWPIGSELRLLPSAAATHDVRQTDPNLRMLCESFCWLLPHIQPERELAWYPWTNEVSHWPQDKLGLPIPTPETRTQKFAEQSPIPWLILTPCLAVDRDGVRLGYGGGFYDSFLSRHGTNCLSVACVPEELCVQSGYLPHEDHDQRVDVIITEQGVVEIAPQELGKKLARLRQLLNSARG